MLLFTIGFDEKESKEITEIYFEYRTLMKAVALRYVKNENDADDIIQDSFFRIRKKILKIISLSCKKKQCYIVNIVKSVSLDHLRKVKRHRRNLELNKNDSRYSDFDDTFEFEEIRVNIERVICQMDEKYSAPLILKCYYGYSTKEICNLLNIVSENTASSLIHRGKKEFLKIYRREIMEEE